MASDYFDFKQFRVWQNNCAMKVNTDSVLLGSLVELTGHETTILDIGTGTGVLALMLAQRSVAEILAVEIDPDAARQACSNFIQSPWGDRLTCIPTKFQELHSSCKFDLILSNPPYYHAEKSFAIERGTRQLARHNHELSFEELLNGVQINLAENGTFWVVLPVNETEEFDRLASDSGLFPLSRTGIIHRPGGKVKRYVTGYSVKSAECCYGQVIIYGEDGKWSEHYKQLTGDFYL